MERDPGVVEETRPAAATHPQMGRARAVKNFLMGAVCTLFLSDWIHLRAERLSYMQLARRATATAELMSSQADRCMDLAEKQKDLIETKKTEFITRTETLGKAEQEALKDELAIAKKRQALHASVSPQELNKEE
jgi:hypothetical protein